ncbi:MAG: imidazole glycerol phosphate synthase subunit HisH [Actinobacteria bacterium]|nr:imidazole glycerol phosphate synthase subunit HisH [Actinomycetota bacterium]
MSSGAGAPRLAVLDYGIGNLRSAQKALEHCGADAVLTADHEVIAAADAVVLPGVGAFGACMDALRAAGLEQEVHRAVASGRPFLGICVGMQMLFDGSEEDPHARGLGVIGGTVRWLSAELPRPQMQWNQLTVSPQHADDPMFAGLGESPWVYFVHSLHGVPTDPEAVAATCEYGGTVNAAFRRDNVFATQFHPEKSGESGLALLTNFVRLAQSVRA